MKFIVSMKDPDALDEAINMAGEELPGLTAEEANAVMDLRRENAREVCRKWFEFGEYLRVEIDTEAKTCTVLPVKG